MHLIFHVGFNNFGGVVTTKSISIIGATAGYVDTKLSVVMNNPSTISITVGDVVLRVLYQGYDIGPAIIKNLVVIPGDNSYDADFQLTPTADPTQQMVLASVLSGYLMAQVFEFNVKGTTDSTSVDSLKEGFAGLDLKTSLTGIPATLISGAEVYNLNFCPGNNNPCSQTTFTIQNNIDTGFSIVSVIAEVWYQPIDTSISTVPVMIGTINGAFDSPFFIGARAQATSAALLMAFNINAPGIDGIVAEIVNAFVSADKYIYVNVVQNATITVGNDGSFHGVLSYSQNHVMVNVATLIDPAPNSLFMKSLSSQLSSSLALSTASIPLSTPSIPATETVPVTTTTPVATTTDVPSTTDIGTPTTTTTDLPTTPTTATVTTTDSPSGGITSTAP
jgi:hypothetical protein